MKHQTINLVKFASLSRKLSLPRCWTIGILEGIWIFGQTNARNGDLTRFSPDDIAAWLEWPGDASELIDALVTCSWLDRYPLDQEDESSGKPYLGLRVHDWDAHKPNWLRGVEARKATTIKPGSQPGTQPGTQPPSPPLPNPSLPSPSLPSPIRSIGRTMNEDKIVITDDEFHAVINDMNKLRDGLLGHGKKVGGRDKDLIWKSVCLIHYQFKAPSWLEDLMRTVREARPDKPMAYYKACLQRKLQNIGVDLNEELDLVIRTGKIEEARKEVSR